MNKFLKPAVLLPILLGAVVGFSLFVLGAADDAPGLCLIGLAAAFLLIMWGIHNAGVIKRGLFAPILLFCFGAGGIVLSIAMLFDIEFKDSPGLPLIGIALGIALIVAGAMRLRIVKTRE